MYKGIRRQLTGGWVYVTTNDSLSLLLVHKFCTKFSCMYFIGILENE